MAQVRYFYIGTRQVKEQVYIEMSPQLASTLDESLDNLNVTLKENDVADPYKPFQRFFIQDENHTTIQVFIISADNVELATQNPPRYKHRLSLVQESEYLTKHEIRNTVFSSDQTLNKKGYVAATTYVPTHFGGQMIDDSARPSVIWSYIYQSNSFEYMKNPTQIDISLYTYSIKELKVKINFNIERVYEEQYDENTARGTIKARFEKPDTWNDVYTNVPHSGTIPLPTIRFRIFDPEVLIYRDWTPEGSNGSTVNVPQDIIDWISGYQIDLLQIYIIHDGSTFINQSLFNGRRLINNPWLVSLCYEFDIVTNNVNYNIYSVIDTLLKQQMKECDRYNSSNDSDNIKPLFLMPTPSHNPDLYNLLKETQVPNLIFTQCSMYDALAEIFKLFDAIFTIDNDGYLDIEYFNEQAQTPIEEPEKAGENRSLSEERFTNKLITYFQNTKINDKFPNSNNVNALAYLRSKKLGVPGENDFVFVVPKPIDIIKSVKVMGGLTFDATITIDYQNMPRLIYEGTITVRTTINLGNPSSNEVLDITPYVVEESIWTILPLDEPPISGDWTKIGKKNTLSYRRGTNYISASDYTDTPLGIKTAALERVIRCAIHNLWNYDDTISWIGISSPNWANVKMAVEYIALVDGKLVNESIDNKYNGETLINQSNGSIDINKLGLNMVGLGLKLGQPTLNMVQKFTSWDDRVKKGQYFVDGNGDRWVANNCVYTIIKPDLVQTNIEFVKNFNGLAKRIELNSEKRLSNISKELTVKCEETYGEYIYYSSSPFNANDREIIGMGNSQLLFGIANTFGKGIGANREERVEYAVITPCDESGSVINDQDLGTLERIVVPLVVYGSGYSVCFEMSFEDPMSAGSQLLDNYTSDLWDGGWFSRAVLYTTRNGTFESCNIEFVKLNQGIDRNFPLMRGLSMDVIGHIDHFNYFKKPNEIIKVVYMTYNIH